jgi:LysR family transcriptional regulator (chromosome initiation inhibitor)
MPIRLPIAVNADSLSTWFLRALSALPDDLAIRFELYQEDQDHTSELLRNGTAMAAVTADSASAQGCRVEPLGAMRYLAVASSEFCTKFFPNGANATAFEKAPMLVFNRKDELQARFAEMISGRSVDPPKNYLPSSTAFIDAARMGLGWGMAPVQMAAEPLSCGELVEIAPRRHLDVPLYWQHWRLDSYVLATLTRAVRETARAVLSSS